MIDFDTLRNTINEKWAALAQAAFDLSNHVGGHVTDKTREQVEQGLGRAAEEYTAAKNALVDAMRPPTRSKRR